MPPELTKADLYMISVATLAMAAMLLREYPERPGIVFRSGWSIITAGTTIYELSGGPHAERP